MIIKENHQWHDEIINDEKNWDKERYATQERARHIVSELQKMIGILGGHELSQSNLNRPSNRIMSFLKHYV